jgi:hypothetical protein
VKKTQVALAAFVLLVVTLFVSGAARADTFSYSYTSQEEVALGGSESCSVCRINITFTVANALAPNTAYFWTADGSGTGNQLDPLTLNYSPFGGGSDASLMVVTDKSGNIEEWQLASIMTFMAAPGETCTGGVSSRGSDTVAEKGVFESVSLSNCTNMSDDANDTINYQLSFEPAWVETTNITTTMNAPEPSTLMLLAIGVLLACVKI